MKPTSKEIERALSVMRELFDNDFCYAITYHSHAAFGQSYRYEMPGLNEWIEKHPNYSKLFSFFRGETKVVIVDKANKNWVIKLNLDNPKREIDYCSEEEKVYHHARKANLAEYFAAIYRIGCVEGYSIYLQEYAEPDTDYFDEKLFNYVVEKYGYYPCDFDNEDEYNNAVQTDADELCEDERIDAITGSESLADFVESEGINDLHTGNWGIASSDGRIVVFDFSGYHG